MATDFFLLSGNAIVSFIFFETIIAIRGRPIFKKILFLLVLVETVLSNFFRHWFKRKQSVDPLKPYFSTNPSFWLMETVFGWLQTCHSELFSASGHYSWRTPLFLFLETIFLNFCRYSCERKQLFPASGNGVFIKSFLTTSVYGFWINFKPYGFMQNFFFDFLSL